MTANVYIAAYPPGPTTARGVRQTKTHAMLKGTQYALCSQLVVAPRFPQRGFDPDDTGVCASCAHKYRQATARPSERTQRAAYDRRKRERFLDHDDEAMRAFMMAMHTGGIANARGNHERATGTIESYHNTIRKLAEWVEWRPWDRIDPGEIHAYLNKPKADGSPQSYRTICQKHTALTVFYNFCIDREFIVGRSPMRHVGRPRPSEDTETMPTTRLPAEREAWDAVMASTLAIDQLLALGLMYFGGLRISEVVIVRPDRVNPLRKEMDFWRPKSHAWQEDFTYGTYVEGLRLKLPERAAGAEEWLDVMEWMTKYRQGEDTLVVSGSINEPEDWWADQLHHHILPKAGLPGDAFTPHRLRHSFGHNMIDAEMDPFELQEAMGHKSFDTTQLYTKQVKRSKKWLDRIKSNDDAGGDVVDLPGHVSRTRRFAGGRGVV